VSVDLDLEDRKKLAHESGGDRVICVVTFYKCFCDLINLTVDVLYLFQSADERKELDKVLD
jgi:hypothetical protein